MMREFRMVPNLERVRERLLAALPEQIAQIERTPYLGKDRIVIRAEISMTADDFIRAGLGACYDLKRS